MLFDAAELQLAPCSEQVLARMPAGLREHTGIETHAAVVEIRTGVHTLLPRAAAELGDLRDRLDRAAGEMGLRCACAGTYPLAMPEHVALSQAPRYRTIARSMRGLVHHPPTMAVHVHVGVPDPDDAVRVLNGLRPAVPLLLALSANSPFCQGRDRGFASQRATIFGGFPRTGTPRAFADYEQYVEVVDALLGSGALPDPTFLWWDLRLQPRFGTVEVRVMDAQMDLADTTAIVALVQSLARMVLEEGEWQPQVPAEVLAENRFLAARDGMDGRLIDFAGGCLRPAGAIVEALLQRCDPHARALGCAEELSLVHELAALNGAHRQRQCLRTQGSMSGVLEMLAERFSPASRPDSAPSDLPRLPAWTPTPTPAQSRAA